METKVTNEELVAGKPRAKRDHSLKRYLRMFVMKVANVLPISKFTRADLYRFAGVGIEKGNVRIGRVSFDTIHPEDINIGKGSVIADGTIMVTHFMDVFNLKEFAYSRGQIKIGRNCYIGSNTIFSKPVTIGDGVIVGAGSVVNKDIPPYEVWAGVPAKCICKRYKDVSELPKSTDEFKSR